MKPRLLSGLVILLLFLIGDMGLSQLLKIGLDRYYGLNKQAEILCVGHSHTVLGIDTRRMETDLGVPVSKYAMAGANTLDRLAMVKQFVGRHPTVKTVVYDVDARIFDSEGLSSASYSLFLPYINDPAMSYYLWEEATWQEYFSSKIISTTRFRDQTLKASIQGLIGINERKKSTRIRIEDSKGRLEQERERKIRINPESRQCFLETIEFLTQHGIKVVLIFIPTIDLLNEIDPQTQNSVTRIFYSLAEQNSNIHFLDYNKDYQHQHELFYDLRHLNGDGNTIVTGRLIEDLRYLLKEIRKS